jgi:class 3 adenylate cyclase/tetratricopeptide (TPR) repeat protein
MQNCPACQAENPEAARFCNQCGKALAITSDKAAPQSYTPKHLADRILKTRGAMQGERKRVTVLFADIKGSTKLAQEAGAELWHEILDRFFAILSTAVHRFEGTVNQYTGDGIMALFGAPIAHEDHAQRACLAALEMQTEVRRFANEFRLTKGINLSMRVGLNTGEVIVGRIGDDLRMDYTAQGHTVNLAARMEHICEPGHIYLSRYTAALVEGYYQLRDLGRMQVAGVDEPVEVYELVAADMLKTRLERNLARGDSPFIGRDDEFSILLNALERVREGTGQVVAVVGNAGIGKSRLCHEFTHLCERNGVAVHRATGVTYGSAVPMLPAQTLLKSRLGLTPKASLSEIKQRVHDVLHDQAQPHVVPFVLDFLGVADAGVIAPERVMALRDPMLDELAHFLPQTNEPQILLIEDLHFLDPDTREFVERLCKEAPKHQTLLLLNYRPDYISEWLIPFLDEQIAVSALTAQQLEKMASGLLGCHESLEGVAKKIRERASGNPFFVEEAVQALAESGHLQGSRGKYQLAQPIVDWPVPDTVHALLAARMDRLPEAHKTLLQSASVIGQEFAPGLLAELAEMEVLACEEPLMALEDAGFVHQRGSGETVEFAFCHPLMQEVAYQTQLESRRALAHGRLAQVLEARHPLTSPPTQAATRIAHHWQIAGQWQKAGAWNLHAARWAAGRDLRVTFEHCRSAMENLERAPLSEEVRRLRIAARSLLIRNAQFVRVEPEEVERAYAEGMRMTQESRDVASAAELMLSYGNELLHRGDAESAARLAEDAVKMCVDSGLLELIGRLRLPILMTHNAAGRPREGVQLVDAGGTDWRLRPVDADNVMSRGFYGSMLSWLGRLSEAKKNLDDAIAFAYQDERPASWMHAFQVEIAWFSGDYTRALPEARLAVQHAEEAGSAFFTAISARALGRALNLHDHYDEAISVLEASRALTAPGAFAHQIEVSYLATLAESYLGAGKIEQAHETAEAALSSAQHSRSRVWEIAAWIAFLALPTDGPWRVRAQEGLARMPQLIDESGAEGFRPWVWLAHAHWATDDAQVRACRAKALAEFERLGATGHVARMRRE